MATITNTRKALTLILTMALLPPSILGARTIPSSPHHSQGHKRSPPPASPPPPPPPPAAPAADAGLVRTTCNSTAYYDLCVSTLGADPSSATADVRGLSSIAVSAAAVNASGGAATAVALATGGNTTTAVDGTVQALLRTCATKYDEARDALSAARDSIAQQDYDYASVHVSAAAEYPQVCRVLFQRQRPGDYPPEMAAREETLRQLCTVALDIITLLSNNTN
jgi:pectinesterase inhibitor-like protein